MTYPTIIRAAIALALVLGSPGGWCCCTAWGMGCSGSDGASQAGTSAGSKVESGCCASSGAPDEHRDDQQHDRNRSCKCGIHAQQADLVRGMIIPGPQAEDLLPLLSKAIAPQDTFLSGDIRGYATGPPALQRRRCARTESLFALRALLTV